MSLIPTTPVPEDYRRKIAYALMKQGMSGAPVQHWAQGLARLGEGALGGYEMYQADEKDKQAEMDSARARIPLLLQGGQPAQTQPAPQSALPPSTPATPTVGKIYSNDESSPLDPPSGADRDNAVRTVIAEAGNQGPTGQNAVASVIRNRAVNGGYGGDTPSGVVTAKNQFEPWNTPEGRAKMAAIDPASPQYQAAAKALESAYAGNDPTNGAVNFISPKVQTALGRDMPKWAQGKGQDIGDHRFFGSPAQPEATPAPYQVAGPATAASSPVAQALAQQPAAAPAQGDDTRSKIVQLLQSDSPAIRKMGMALADNFITSQMKPNDYGFQTQPDGTILRTDPRTGTVAPVYQGATKPSFGQIGEDENGKKTYGFIDAAKGKVTPLEPAKAGDERPTVTGPDGKEIVIPKGVDVKTFRNEISRINADAAGGKMTEVQAKATSFANRMEKAEESIANGGLEKEGGGVSGAVQQIAGGVPVVGEALQTPNYQKFSQAKSQFITAMLRQESGAAINKEEFRRYDKELFPQPGDGPEVIAQKAEARKVAIDGMKKGAGPAYKSPAPAAKSAPVTKSIGGKEYYQENGQWFEK